MSGAFDLAATNRAIAAALVTAGIASTGYAWPSEGARPGDAVVGYPDSIEFDLTFQRGYDQVRIPFWVLAGLVADESTLDRISDLMAGGASDVKAALEGTTLGDVISSLRITSATVVPFAVGTQTLITYLSVRFEADVIS